MKQISVTLPCDLHSALRELAKRTRSGEPVDSVLREIFPVPPVTTPAAPTTPATLTTPPVPKTPTARPTPPVPKITAFEAKLEMLPGHLPAWRQWLLRRLLPPLASH
ncbi:hypothetical protein [Burkholderia sp. KJ006]|uniref:hypothetical protein n=1 Tax=Burkholderia sp. KJ006 TaxID=416344 RepID=UPI0011D22E22|nr:hypothetical protein [Burkholderia sp. KJ006]